MTPLRIRALESQDFDEIPRVLNAAFGSYRDATRYNLGSLAFFRSWMWEDSPSLVLASKDSIYGVLFGGIRDAQYQDQPLKILHIGPAGIVPRHRRKGHGSEMMRTMTQLAREADVDLLSLTTEAAYGAHRMYRRAGFDVLEAYRPLVRLLIPEMGNAAPHPDLTLSEKASPPRFDSNRENAIVEIGPEPPALPTRLRPRHYSLAGGEALTVQWPVISRHGEREEIIHATQLLHWRPGEQPNDLIDSICVLSAQDKSVCVYALRSTSMTLPGFSSKGAPMVYRMVRGLTEKGKTAASQAKAYDEICPAP